MNALVVYDSQYGNTERIAQVIAESMLAFAQARAVRVNAASNSILHDVDMLVVGCPTQSWRPTQHMQAFIQGLSQERLRGVAVACFDTRFQKARWLTGSAATSMAKRFQSMGVSLIAPPESFFVEDSEGPLVSGEVERAATWARALGNVAMLHPPLAQR